MSRAVEVGGEAELRGIGHFDRLRFRIETEQRRHRPEGFLAPRASQSSRRRARSVRRRCRRARRLPPVRMRALRGGIGEVCLDLLQSGCIDQRSLHDVRLAAGADLQHRHARCELLRKGLINAGLHQKAVGADAGLAGVAVLGYERPSTAASTSASSKTMKGALPPSSRASFLIVGALCAISRRPTSVEPVKER